MLSTTNPRRVLPVNQRESKRGRTVTVVVLCALATLWVGPQCGAAGGSSDRGGLDRLFARRARAIRTGDRQALRKLYTGSPREVRAHLFARWPDGFFHRHHFLRYERELQLVGLHGQRALVREWRRLTGTTAGSTDRTVLEEGSCDYALLHLPVGWRFMLQEWPLPNLERDVARCLSGFARKQSPGVLQLVAELRGGRWRPDRYLWWKGAVRFGPQQGDREQLRQELTERLHEVLTDQYELEKPGWVHLFVQKNGEEWRAAGGTWYETTGAASRWSIAEPAVRALDRQAEANFGDPQAHIRLAQGLTRMGLYAAAYGEYQRAAALAPASVSAKQLKAAAARLTADPLVQARQQVRFEASLGIAEDHPLQVLTELRQRARRNPADPEVAAALGIELARLGGDSEADRQLERTRALLQGRRPTGLLARLLDELVRQVQTLPLKPQAVVRSKLFTLRFAPGDEALFRVMGALERAQHLVYSRFQIPLGATEVLLFPDRTSFDRYTYAVRGERLSPLTAAYSVGDQIVTFSQLRTDNLSMVAHELGHVVAHRLARGNPLAPWFDEGLACCIQGGYWGYQDRVRKAAGEHRLLSYETIRDWNIADADSLLAYSQANHLVDFFIHSFGSAAVGRLLKEVGRGASFAAAFRGLTHLTQQQFYDRWKHTISPTPP